MSAIELRGVTFAYRATDATGARRQRYGVTDVDLCIGQGEFVVLAGDSGCGKTTLTRLVNGLVPHYYEGELAGEVTVCGLDVRTSKIGALSLHVGSVFQNPRSQFFNVDTTSELAFASENQGRDPARIRQDIGRVVDEMGMAALMDRSIFALSGGEKQKVACASVAVAEPEVMVLDEPSSNLDAAGIRDLQAVLALWKRKGKTVVVAEHRLYYLTGLADRLLVMREGRIAEELASGDLAGMTDADAYRRGLRAFTQVTMPSAGAAAASADVAGRTLACQGFDFSYKGSGTSISYGSMEFAAGSITAIVGRNGAGKSTFARTLCGLEKKGVGEVTFGGRTWRPRDRSHLCYLIMQDVNHQLFADSVLEEVLLSVPAHVPHDEACAKAREVLGRLGLAELEDTHPMALSGGQKQRVAIASGVVAGAPVLVFDEPTSGLDLAHMRQVGELLRMLRDDGKVVIVITHDAELVRDVADRVVSLE